MSDETRLALRQQRLLLRSAALRSELAEQAVALEPAFAIADRLHAGALWAWRERAVLIGGAAVVLLVLRPRRVWRIATFAFWVWRRKRRLQAWLGAAGIAPAASASRDSGAAR